MRRPCIGRQQQGNVGCLGELGLEIPGRRVAPVSLLPLQRLLPLDPLLLTLDEGLELDHGGHQQQHHAARGKQGGEVGSPSVVTDDDRERHASVGGTQVGDPAQEALRGTHRLGAHQLGTAKACVAGRWSSSQSAGG